MPIVQADGVEYRSIIVDGQTMDEVWVDGVKVYDRLIYRGSLTGAAISNLSGFLAPNDGTIENNIYPNTGDLIDQLTANSDNDLIQLSYENSAQPNNVLTFRFTFDWLGQKVIDLNYDVSTDTYQGTSASVADAMAFTIGNPVNFELEEIAYS